MSGYGGPECVGVLIELVSFIYPNQSVFTQSLKQEGTVSAFDIGTVNSHIYRQAALNKGRISGSESTSRSLINSVVMNHGC